MRHAFLRHDAGAEAKDTDGPPAEIAITSLGFNGDPRDYLLSNVNRWRGQMQLPKVSLEELARSISSIDTASGAAVLVDLEGKIAAGGMSGRGPFAGGAPERPFAAHRHPMMFTANLLRGPSPRTTSPRTIRRPRARQ